MAAADQKESKPPLASRTVKVLPILTLIAGILLILSFLRVKTIIGILFCISAYGFYLRRRWAGYIAGTLSSLAGLWNLFMFLSTVFGYFGNTMDDESALAITRNVLWLLLHAAIVSHIFLSWSMLGKAVAEDADDGKEAN